MSAPLRAAIFDKDGTLVDFHATWDPATGAGLRAATSDEATLQAAADAIGYDLVTDTIRPDSIFVAETNDVIFAALEPHVDIEEFGAACMVAANDSTVPADGLPDLLTSLRGRGVGLAVATNDWEQIAIDQLEILGWADLFDVVMGSDSGHGAKPEPGMVLEAARRLGVEPSEAIMIGDTAHDLHAGRAAGMETVLVTGAGSTAAVTPETTDLADVVVSSLAELEAVLVERGRLAS
ncbi:MAG: HAD family hydrolase [Actinomycetota bacterium]